MRRELLPDQALSIEITYIIRMREGEAAAFRLLERVWVFTPAESLGEGESLIEHAVLTQDPVLAILRGEVARLPARALSSG
jgi:hypothetical protein